MTTEEIPAVASDEEEQRTDASLHLSSVDIVLALPEGEPLTLHRFPVDATLSDVKVALAQYYETTLYTSYCLDFVSFVEKDGTVIPCTNNGSNAPNMEETNDLQSFLSPNTQVLNVKLVPLPYDSKGVLVHLQRINVVVHHPPHKQKTNQPIFDSAATLILQSDSNVATEEAVAVPESADAAVNPASEPEKEKKEKQQDARVGLPSKEEIAVPMSSEHFISSFFSETLLRVSNTEIGARMEAQERVLQSQLRCIAVSGWNPPPPHRRMQGDLCYIEVVTATEGTLHITANRRGFYLNKSNKSHFDPSPQPKCHLSHELLHTVTAACPTVATAWKNVYTHNKAELLRMHHQLTTNGANGSQQQTNKNAEGSGAGGRKKNKQQDRDSSVRGKDEPASDSWIPTDALTPILIVLAQGLTQELFLRPSWCALPAGYLQQHKNFHTKKAIAAAAAAAAATAGDEAEEGKQGSKAVTTRQAQLYGDGGVQFGKNGLEPHTYDTYRSQLALADTFRTEECGVARLWLAELSAVRKLGSDTQTERMARAKFGHKIVSDFTDACKALVRGIAEGMVAPLDPTAGHALAVYFHNNIFVSKAVDPKDDTKLFSGDAAYRRALRHDQVNQKALQALGIQGIDTVLTTLVDYLGTRYMCQLTIPGLLNSNSSRRPQLLYGMLTLKNELVVKENSLLSMEKVAKAMFFPKRNLPLRPVDDGSSPGPDTEAEAEAATVTAATSLEESDKHGGSEKRALIGGDASKPDDAGAVRHIIALMESEEPSSLTVNSEGNVEPILAADGKTRCVPHVGPLECKLLEGTDDVTYVLDALRLTPRDANFVAEKNGGTGYLLAEQLKHCDVELAKTYVLRLELVSAYLEQKLAAKKKAIIEKFAEEAGVLAETATTDGDAQGVAAVAAAEASSANNEEGSKPAPGESTSASPQSSNGNVTVSKEGGGEEDGDKDKAQGGDTDKGVSQGDKAPEPGAEKPQNPSSILSRLNPSQLQELNKQLATVTTASLDLQLNPNVFMGFPVDVDAAVVAHDEECARDLADYLWNTVLPALTARIRDKDFTVRDCEAAVDYIHSHGVNIRYLGPLINLATTQEEEDISLFRNEQQRVHGMPLYWRELLTVEALARAVKHTLNEVFNEDMEQATAPAETVAFVFTCLFEALGAEPSEEPSTKGMFATGGNKGEAPAPAAGMGTAQGKNAKKNKKKKEQAAETIVAPAATAVAAAAAAAEVVSPSSAKLHCLQRISHYLLSRFLVDLPLHALSSQQQRFLRERIYAPLLLRRLCQVCGIQVAMRDYQFIASDGHGSKATSKAAASAPIFRACDIMQITPITKTCEPDVLSREISAYIRAAAMHLKDERFDLAYRLASEAVHLAEYMGGNVHPVLLQANEQLLAVYRAAGDDATALKVAGKVLLLSTQLYGLDSNKTLHYHMECATLNTQLDHRAAACEHFLVARYLIQLLGGPRHPDLPNLYYSASTMYGSAGDLKKTMQCIKAARQSMSSDMLSYAGLTHCMATLLAKQGFYLDAQREQTALYRLLCSLYGENDPRAVNCRETLVNFTRDALTLTTELYNAQGKHEQTPPSVPGKQNDAARQEDGEGADKKKKKKNKSKSKK